MAHRALLETIATGTALDRREAAKELAGCADAADGRALIRLLRHAPSSAAREAAAWVIGFMGHEPAGTIWALLACLEDSRESPVVRAKAAEALGERLESSPPRPETARAGRALTEALGHPDPEIRFWSVFALGKLRFRPALPALRALAASDARFCAGFWRIDQEARAVLRLLRTGRGRRR